jgi:hypothetical protein
MESLPASHLANRDAGCMKLLPPIHRHSWHMAVVALAAAGVLAWGFGFVVGIAVRFFFGS